jgi:hypothetical protein
MPCKLLYQKIKETETSINRTAVSMTTIGMKKTGLEIRIIKTDAKNRVRLRIPVEEICSVAE